MALEEVKESTLEFDKLIARVKVVVVDKYDSKISVDSALYIVNELLDWREANGKECE